MTDFELLVDLHQATERQGPGSTADTLKALSFVPIAQEKDIKIADIVGGKV